MLCGREKCCVVVYSVVWSNAVLFSSVQCYIVGKVLCFGVVLDSRVHCCVMKYSVAW